MSGTKEKTTGQQIAKGRAVKVSAPEVASTDAPDLSGTERPVTLPGHYIAVGAAPVSVTPEITGVATEQDLVSAVMKPETNDVEALEVRSISERGFWRCGRFWSRQPVSVFASDDPEGDNVANNAYLGIQADCFISHTDAARLKSDPQLVVTVVETTTESD